MPTVVPVVATLSDCSDVGVWVLPLLPGADGVVLGPGAAELERAFGLDLMAVADDAGLTGRAGATTLSVSGADTPLVGLVGVGDQSVSDLRTAGAAAARLARGRSALATTAWAADDPQAVAAFVEGMLLASFSQSWRAVEPQQAPASRLVLAGCDLDDAVQGAALRRGAIIARAGWRSRAVASMPSRTKTPHWVAEQAVQLAADSGLECTVWDEHQLAADGFEAILGVGQGSAHPPRLIRLDYAPVAAQPEAPRRRVVLVGKGITFDTGGLWLKPTEGMATMRRDVTGGAVVLAVMSALRDLDVGLEVTGLVAAAENAVSGKAQRPGDVVRHHGGRTTEVVNTDAEGRLVLADALAYAVRALEPTVLVDVATLTGAVKVALGTTLGGLFASDDALADALLAAGQHAGEPLWRLPLVDDYVGELESQVADAQNMGGAGPSPSGAGSVVAALFLRPFTAGLPWAHLDLSSVGDARADVEVWTAGPTGFGARALLQWLTSTDPLAGVTPAHT